MKTNRTVFAWISIIAFFSVFGSAYAADLPRAQLDESEHHFTEAYLRFLDQNHWEAANLLDRALKANTYLVDYYLLKGLTMNRIGDYGAGREALEYYLEVRAMDFTAPRILSYTIAQKRDLQRLAGTAPLSARWRISRPDLQTEFQFGPFRPFNVKGIGKADANGTSLYISDTLGDLIAIRKKGIRETARIFVVKPTAALPMGDGSFYVLTANGEVYSFSDFPGLEPLSPDLAGTLENFVADAAILSSEEFVVADPVAREIVFYSFTPFARTDFWVPPEDVLLFEPVAVAAYGPWLAAADRGNGKIFIINSKNGQSFCSFDLPYPRDVCWSALGELFVITEKGELFRVAVDFLTPQAEPANLVANGIENGWTLFNSPQGDLYCMDSTASKLWKAESLPNVDVSSGYLSISRPSIYREQGRESFLLEASLMSPFVSYTQSSSPVVYSVWNNRAMPSFATWRNDLTNKKTDILVFQRPSPTGSVNPTLKNMIVGNGADIQIALPSLWKAHKETLTDIIVDTSILFSRDELDALTLFCLNNGIRLNFWAKNIPTLEMTRSAALSAGKVFYSLTNIPDLEVPRNRMQIRIPLPQELSSSGYPGRSMLTVYLDVGLMHTRDWIPLWPDMLE